MRHDEMPGNDGLDIFGLDETIEFFAPASPGGVEQHPDGAAVAGLGFGGVQDGIGGGGSVVRCVERGGGGR